MYIKIIAIGLLLFSSLGLNAQVDSLKMNIDLRTRGELDNGVKTLIPESRNAETSVLSRARFGLDYYAQKLQIYISIQDVRTWGETGTSVSKNQNLTLNEAWAKYQISPSFGLKLGRQILSYDDERLVGALDWAMQGRSFDGLKGILNLSANSKLETVITYNNDGDDSNNSAKGEIYGVAEGGERTKALQILHYQYKNAYKFQISGILLNNVLQNASGTHYDMLTAGLNVKKYFDKVGIYGSTYYQIGKNTLAQHKSAYQFSLNVDFLWRKKINTIFGTEWLSGKDYNTLANKNKSFNPLYGTNHVFNGYMDYFYNAGSYFNSYGLNDYYLKTNFILSPAAVLSTNIHGFTTNGTLGLNAQGEHLSSYLGTEVDIVFRQNVGKVMQLNIGQSLMFADDSMKVIKNVLQTKDLQSWTWVGVKISPSFRLK